MIAAVLAAAGRSVRFGADKLQEIVEGREVWLASLEALRSHPEIGFVIIVAHEDRLAEIASASGGAPVVAGGSTRAESVARGIAACPAEAQFILVHDAARPFVSPQVISRVIAAIRSEGAAFAAVPVTDSIKMAGEDGIQPLERSRLWAAQTPQGGRADWMRLACLHPPGSATDEAEALHAAGFPCLPALGDPANRKITHPGDLPSQDTLMETRTGIGYDIHAFSADPDRPLWLGGIEFDDRPGLEGHSDADALLHAIADAVLGAAGLGDIGEHFKNTDPRWKDRRSRHFVEASVEMAAQAGWQLRFIDASVMAERPKISPRKLEMRLAIAEMAGLPIESISLKATTNEGLGAIGRGEGIAALAVATLARISPLTESGSRIGAGPSKV
jgi:2-C-methyl-D-erythritol 4-phosphate cytidylyltransferase/2-C-methyl-D-erythritol 2,4-cyclodiphosphate synthase